MMPPRILISHVYSSNNNGDAAILSAQIAELGRVFPGANIRISTIDQVPADYSFDGAAATQALMYGAVAPGRSKAAKLFFTAAMVPYTMLWAAARRALHADLPLPGTWRAPLRLLAEADMQVCVGGGYLRAKPDMASTVILLLLVHQIWLARILGKPVYLYAQSFGPYYTGLQRWLARSGINTAALVLVREAKSEQQLADLYIPKARTRKVPDSAFLFTARPNKKIAVAIRPSDSTDTVVGITVRNWLEGDRQAAYEAAIAELIRHLAAKPRYRVVIIPQVTSAAQHDDDREAAARIAGRLGPKPNVAFLTRRFSHKDILSVYGSLDYLVGTRFHSVIFALTKRVPAIAIEYEHKTSGIMQDLGLSDWVVPIEQVEGKKIIHTFESLVRKRKSYLRQLDRILPVYTARAHSAAGLIARDFAHRAQTK